MIKINYELQAQDLKKKIDRLFEISGAKILAIDKDEKPGSPPQVITVNGKYTPREWTDWTRGFVYGSALLQFDATWDESFLRLGRDRTLARMSQQLTNFGVDDHGFNVMSTFGNLWRLLTEGRIAANDLERAIYELAIKCSGAVQAQRWSYLTSGEGYIYSFCGPHSLLIETIRSLRVLGLSHKLGHVLIGERDRKISLLNRLIEHAKTTANHSVYYAEGRDAYDAIGRVTQEAVFNIADGSFRCPATLQGYSPFTTWTRGLAWAICGFAELLEFAESVHEDELKSWGGRRSIEALLLKAATATADFYIEHSPSDGIPYWDTGAFGLGLMEGWQDRPADPFNEFEPVDSSAASIAAQGMLRLGTHLRKKEKTSEGRKFWHAGLTILSTLFGEPYLSVDPNHQGLILHAVYHRPNGWDYIPSMRRVPCGESAIWGDYHAREVALYLRRVIENKPYLAFFGH
jgi:hypothetical protein